jgi:hypothetical protein
MATEIKQENVRFPLKEHEALKRTAAENNMSPALFIRTVVAHACGSVEALEEVEAARKDHRREHGATLVGRRWKDRPPAKKTERKPEPVPEPAQPARHVAARRGK